MKIRIYTDEQLNLFPIYIMTINLNHKQEYVKRENGYEDGDRFHHRGFDEYQMCVRTCNAVLELAEKEEHVLFGGRLGQYKYYDMDKVIEAALAMVKEQLHK